MNLWKRLAALSDAALPGIKPLAAVILGVQFLLAAIAIPTKVMVHGDGAFFVYVLAVGQAWHLKWSEVASRASAYLFTVAPMEWLTRLFDLGPVSIAALNGFVFYAVPAILFALACALVWKCHPKFLVFPVANYVLASSLGFGFPSEILLAPGFLWIALFLILRGKATSPAFLISLCGLVLSHEVALPAALVAGYLAYRDGATSRAKAIAGAYLAIALLIFLALRLGGNNAGSQANAIYVFDPRRLFSNPTLWTVLALGVVGWYARRWLSRWYGFCAALLVAVVVPIAIQWFVPAVNFELGRYDSTRTIVGIVMLLLALAFAAVKSEPTVAPVPNLPLSRLLALALAVSLSCTGLFLHDWLTAEHAVERLAATAPHSSGPAFIAFETAGTALTPREARAIDRVEFTWALPYESIVLADALVPGQILYSAGADYKPNCSTIDGIDKTKSRIPAATLDAFRRFSCAYQPPPPLETKFRHFKAWLHKFLSP